MEKKEWTQNRKRLQEAAFESGLILTAEFKMFVLRSLRALIFPSGDHERKETLTNLMSHPAEDL